MALQGTLDTFALPDVLRLLAATKKTGRLRITSGLGGGSLWVDGGSLSAIEASHAPLAVEPVDALFELLRFEEGSFTFDTDASPEATGGAEDVDELLEAAGAMLAEWRQLEAVVPSLDAWVALRPSLDKPEVTIGQHHWATLVLIGAGASVGQMGERLALPELPVARALRDLAELGLVEISPRAPTPTPSQPSPEPVGSSADDAGAVPLPSGPVEEADPSAREADRPTDGAALGDLAPAGVILDAGPFLEGAADAADANRVDDADADYADAPLPMARPIRARRARGSSRPSPEPVAQDRFVPLELPGQGAGAYDPVEPAITDAVDPARDGPAEVDDFAAAFPGLAHRTTASEDTEDDLARQMAALPPEVAEAVRAAAEAATEEERDAVLDEIDDGEAAPLNRGLLLKFLSSVRG